MEKLVRDRVPEIMRAAGQSPTVRRAHDDEMLRLLKAKLQEEAYEVANSTAPVSTLEELADLTEVILALLLQLRFTNLDLDAVRRAKRDRAGGFELGLVLQRD